MLHLKSIVKSLFVLIINIYFLDATANNHDYSFVKNKGQLPEKVIAKVVIPGGTLFIEKGVFTYNFYEQKKISEIHNSKTTERTINAHALKIVFKNANKNIEYNLEDESKFYENYFIGNNKKNWVSNVHHYKTLLQKNIYNGIDLKMHTLKENLKYDLIIKPNANPNRIKLSYQSVKDLFIKNGNLYVKTSVNTITEQKPFAYQFIEGNKKEISCKYKLTHNNLGFEFPDGYNKNYDLIIDPTLIFSSYSGSTANNFGYTATYDDFGFLYSGSTVFGVGYPTTLGAYQINFAGGTGNGGTDIAITKYDTSGTIAIYSTYLGGSKDELPHSMIVNSANEIFIFGTSGSDDYPTTINAFQNNFIGGPPFLPSGIGISYPDGCDIITSRLSTDGGNLLASTYLGGSENDGLNLSSKLKFNYADDVRGEIDIDKNNNVYIATCTRSTDFPIIGGVFQAVHSNLQEGIIIKMDNQLTNIIWSSFLGGKGDDAIYSLALDNDDNIYVTGGTTSDDLPTSTNALNPNYLDSLHADAFVSYLSNDGTQIISSTYFGSNEYDQAFFVELDKAQNVYLFGQTKATGNTLIHQANYSVPGGGEFIAKLSANLDVLLQSTVVGSNTGTPNISPTAFLVDVCNKIYISGWGSNIGIGNAGTTSNLPITNNAFQTTTDGNDFYLMVLDENMDTLIYATYFGGNQATEHVDGGTSRFDKKGIVYQCVCAGCGGFSDFPIKPNPGAVSPTNNSATGSQCNSAVFKFNFDFPMTIADFSAPWVGCDTTITFQNLSTGAVSTNYQWFFGDGNSSTQMHPTHNYTQNGIYDITLITNDPTSCNESDTVIKQIYIISNTSTNLQDVEICKNKQTQIGLLPVNDPTISYFWFPSYGLSSITVSNPFTSTDSTIEYQLLISSGNCYDTISQLVKVNQISVDVGNDTSFCKDSVLLKANSDGFPNSYLWSSSENFIDTLSLDSFLYVDIPMKYFVMVSDGICEATDSILLFSENIDFFLSGIFDVCEGDTAFIKTNNLIPSIPLTKFEWFPSSNLIFNSDSSSVWIDTDSSLWIFVRVENQNGCELKDSIFILVKEYPIIDSIWVDKNPIYKNESTMLHIQTSDSVLWSTSDVLKDISVSPTTDSLFYAQVYNELGCITVDSILIQIIDIFCNEEKIIIPTAFTPNNIEPNNTYRIVDNEGIITTFKLKIFNRFGQKVFSSNNKTEEWDGKFKNKLLLPQVFDFYLEIECFGGKKLFKKGNISLIR